MPLRAAGDNDNFSGNFHAEVLGRESSRSIDPDSTEAGDQAATRTISSTAV